MKKTKKNTHVVSFNKEEVLPFSDRVAAFDLDINNHSLFNIYSVGKDVLRPEEPHIGVKLLNIHKTKSHEYFVEYIQDNGQDLDHIVYDLPGGSMAELVKIMGDTDTLFQEMRESGFEPVILNIITPDDESTKSVRTSLDLFPNARHVVVKNMREADEDMESDGLSSFIYFDGEDKDVFENLDERLQDAGGIVVELPRMRGPDAAKVKRHRLMFREAAIRKQNPINTRVQGNVNNWRKVADRNFKEMISELRRLTEKEKFAFLVVSDKGGVGKSTFSKFLVDHLRFYQD